MYIGGGSTSGSSAAASGAQQTRSAVNQRLWERSIGAAVRMATGTDAEAP